MEHLKHWIRKSAASLPLMPAVIPDLTKRVTQSPTCQTNTSTGVDLVNCTLDKTLSNGLDIFFAAITSLAIIFLLVAGIQYIQAYGNADAVKTARRRITNIVIAIILLVATYTVINLITRLAGFAAGQAS